ncbi:MAG TPA: VWA domain-containing protein, partial [Pseudorhizobium sp.]|nr:VWA domain-containing protein [Pseudorhizobium sp.]
VFLHFLHALTEKRTRVQTFLFGTRLTNVTRQMRRRDPDDAIAACSDAVADWSGGTRIGAALADFNRLWGRRVLGQGAIVLLITDGLEREGVEELEKEMDRLHRSCRRLVWLNPLLRFDGFEPRARGVRAMLPHVDELRSVHNLQSVADLASALSDHTSLEGDPRRFLSRSSAA